MVNGNYVLYGDRPSSESEIVDDHIHSRSNDRKNKRKINRTANELQHTLNLAQLDNETDSVKYEKKIKEPRLLRYVPTTDVEENFVTEKFETYDLKPTEERPRRYAFTKKPKNPTDGSVNYAYSRSSSSCSSPNGNLPTISEHGEQYGTYRVRAMPSPTVNDLIAGYDTKLDKYFSKPRDVKPFSAKGSHPDSLYRVPADSSAGANKVTRVLRVLRWPVALISVCVALAVFVYFLMPDNLEARSDAENGTYWEPVVAAGHHPLSAERPLDHINKKPDIAQHGTKTSEIDFYATENDKLTSVVDTITERTPNRILPILPVFPTHLTPEVQYGNEQADTDNLRTSKILEGGEDGFIDSTLKPHITQSPETPLAIYFKNSSETTPTNTETITRAETVNDFTYGQKSVYKKIEVYPVKTSPYKEYIQHEYKPFSLVEQYDTENDREPQSPNEAEGFFEHRPTNTEVNFTSGHSKLFGISIEDAERMKSTTQSSLYNTRVSPTLPTWRDGDDTTTKKYPNNIYSDVQCRSTRMSLCRGVLPYDLAGASAQVGNVEITSLIPQIDFLVATNCSDRVRHFICALLEPECNPPPFPPKLPCRNLCKAVVDSCEGNIPGDLSPVFHCKQYPQSDCVAARTPCYTREFTCSDGSCVPRDWICDGSKDCSAGEDEATCVQCEQTEYRCSSGGCILKRWLCDGYADCPGGEDESESTCGQSPQQLSTDIHEAGEEYAGSAPAPAVRRPNRVPTGRKPIQRAGDNESSRELLVTSDSNNSFKRNYTRRPLPSRLSQYYHPQTRISNTDEHKMGISERRVKKGKSKSMDQEKTTQKNILENESIEDVNMGDLGLFEEFDKEGKDQSSDTMDQKAAQRLKVPKFGVPPPNAASMQLPATQISRLDKSTNKLDKVIDGASLLRKAVAAQADTVDDDRADLNTSYVDREDVPDSDITTNTAAVPAPAPRVNHTVAVGENKAPSPSANLPRNWTPKPPEVNVPAAVQAAEAIKAVYSPQDWKRAHSSPCPSGELRCVDGRCITLSQLCDGTIDCSDHADEDNCYT